MEPTWNFVSTGGGRDDGINNPMIEQFSGNYNYSLAREVIQNSLDAKTPHSTEPVTVAFKLEEISKKDFPGHSQLLDVLQAGQKYYKDDNKAQEFLDNAINCLQKDVIPFLKISDFNTTGLLGDDNDKKGGWYNLVKATGSSPKLDGGGSFGIGKGAPFAASNLRVVFYSTFKKGGYTKFQGIAELVSHEVGGIIKRGVGSFGNEQNSVANPKDIPERFWRKGHVGTDLFIAGYKNDKGWQKNLIQSVLRNFWYAIAQNDLIVQIGNEEITQNTLEKCLTDNFVKEPFKDYVEPIGNPLQYYLSVKNGKSFEKKVPTLKLIKFYFYQTEEHLNYVAMLRKSHMVIYSRRFNFPGNYAGVFICDDEIGNLELRKMEPPAHDKWYPERNKENGTKAMEEITVFIRDCLEQMKISKTSGVLDIPELYKYLPFDDGEDNGDGDGVSQYTGQESEEESSKKIQKKEIFENPVEINPFKVAVLNLPDKGNGNKKENNLSGGGKSKNKRSGGTKDNNENLTIRSFLAKQTADKLDYVLLIKGNKSGKYNITVSAVGEEGTEKLNITNVTANLFGKILFSGNRIHSINLTENIENKLTITIESPIKCSLKVEAYALQ